MKFDPNDDKISVPSSSEDDEEFLASESEEEQPVKDPLQQDESDSDSAPEAVSFKSAQEDNLLAKKHAAEVIRTQKDERRKKRKELHLQNLKQREEKKMKIESKRLPDDLLEDLDEHPDCSVLLPSVSESHEPEVKADTKEDEKEILAVHGPTLFKCKILPSELKKKRHVPEKVANFKERAFFNRRIRREKSTRESVLKTVKQLARNGKFCT